MTTPSFLHIRHITCNETDDSIGADDLYGLLGVNRFTIGRFHTGNSYRVDIERAVPEGVTTLRIFEDDTFDNDDEIGTIDLTEAMDTERTIRVGQGSGSYDITFLVVSADIPGPPPLPRCRTRCTFCGADCMQILGHEGNHQCANEHTF